METRNDRNITKGDGLCPITSTNSAFHSVPHHHVGNVTT
jgi:hypothetical protein